MQKMRNSLLAYDDFQPGEDVPMSISTTTSRIAAAQAWRSCVQVLSSEAVEFRASHPSEVVLQHAEPDLYLTNLASGASA